MALAFVLPTVLFAGLTARGPLPHLDSKPRNAETERSLRQSDRLSHEHKIHTYLTETGDPTMVQVVLEPLDDLSAPDLLVYWCPELPTKDKLPTKAVLLGPLENSEPLHLRHGNSKGFLILYSLAHQSIIDEASLETVR